MFSSDAKMLTLSFQLLQSELEDQSAARNKVNELAHNLVTKSATPTSAQQIVVEVSEQFSKN